MSIVNRAPLAGKMDCKNPENDGRGHCKWCGRPVNYERTRGYKAVHARGHKRMFPDPRKEK